MNARKESTASKLLRQIFDIHDCVRDIGGYRVIVELCSLLALILLFALPAIIW